MHTLDRSPIRPPLQRAAARPAGVRRQAGAAARSFGWLLTGLLAISCASVEFHYPCEPGEVLECACDEDRFGSQVCPESGLAGECVCDPGEDPGTDPGGDPGTDPGEDPGTDPGENPGTDPGGNPGEDPGTDPGEIPAPGPGVPAPEAPLEVVAEGVAPDAVDLYWSPVSQGGVTYRVYRNGSLIASTQEPAHEDRNLEPNRSYTYTVTAGNTGGESAPTKAVTATTHRANANGDIRPGSLRHHTTLKSIGFEWELSGDANRNATVDVRYRAVGSFAWRKALPLLRVQYRLQNNLAGSILFLEPNTTYDVILYLTDRDGGAWTRRERITTRAVPSIPTDGRTFHVMPGSGGGDGSQGNPFRGVAAAQAVARPGDVFLLRAGRYGGRIHFTAAGQPGRHVVWKAAGDGAPIFNGVTVAASHMRLDGLRIEAGASSAFPVGLFTENAPRDVAVVHCTVVGNHYSIWLNRGGSDWYIADNTIVGTTAPNSGSQSGEGIELQKTPGHVVAYNRISNVADGVSYCQRNCDIYGNDIFDTSDDGIEPDGGFANIRIWGNRLHNTGHNGVSFQPMEGAPWYVIRNQIIGNSEGPLKFRGTDRFVFMHNTVVGWSNIQTVRGGEMLNAYSRNNVWISVRGGYIWHLGSDPVTWRTNMNHDGFDWGGSSVAFRHGGINLSSVQALTNKIGIQPNGKVLPRTCFPTLNVPAPPPASVPSQRVTLAAGCPGIDAGVPLPNINEGYLGAAPDMGAFEFGAPPPHYGPR